jgi:hypothetical protein
MDNGQEEMEAQVVSLASRIDANQKEMKAMLDPCLEIMEENPELQSVAVHQKVPTEEAAVEMIAALKNWPGDRYLALGRRRQSKRRIQSDGGSRQMSAATRGRLTRCAIPASHKGHGRQDQERTVLYKEHRKDRRSAAT